MTTLTATHPDYLKLARRFAPRPLRTDREHAGAMEILIPLITCADSGLTAGESDYADALGRFVTDWEETHCEVKAADMTPLEALKYLMRESGMTVTDLSKVLGTTHAAASMITGGKREISKATARKLAERFKVNVGLFI